MGGGVLRRGVAEVVGSDGGGGNDRGVVSRTFERCAWMIEFRNQAELFLIERTKCRSYCYFESFDSKIKWDPHHSATPA